MKSMLYVFISVILTAAAAAAQGTAPTIADNATPQDNAIKMRSVELERVKREAAKKDGSTAPAINTAVESKFPQIKEDFEGIQIAEAAIIKTYTTDKVIDYSLIAISAENIGKHADRLDSNLFVAGSPEEPEVKKEESEKKMPVRDLIIALDEAIGRFVSSKIFSNFKVVEPEVAAGTRNDLLQIKSISMKLAEAARAMK